MDRKTLMIVGGILAVGVVCYFVMKGSKPADQLPPPPPPQSEAPAAPRGKLPWATGDVSLWDDE